MQNFRAARLSRSSRRGGTLMEMGIAISVCVLVLGAIYVAWGSTRTTPVADEVTHNLGQVVDNVRSYYAGRGGDSAGLADPACTDGALVLPEIPVNTGIYPRHIFDATGNRPISVGLCDRPNGVPQIHVRYTGIPEFACQNVVLSASYAGRDMRLSRIVINGAARNFFDMTTNTDALNVDAASRLVRPSSPKMAESCRSPNTTPGRLIIDWYYMLRP